MLMHWGSAGLPHSRDQGVIPVGFRSTGRSRGVLASVMALVLVFASVLFANPATALDPVSPPPVTAQAVYVFDSSLGIVLYELNSNEQRSPASLTKIVTALLVARLAPDVSQLVTIDPADVLDASDGQSMMALLEGDVISIEDLLYGLMLNSGNDAANTLARYLGQQLLDAEGATGDPRARFVDEMNAYATELGLTGSHFMNAEGLYDPQHYTTAHDLGVMAGLLLENELLATIVSTKEITVTSELGNAYTLQNTNKLLGEPGITGMKTGTLPESGACLAASKIGPAGTNIVSIVLGSDIEFSEDGIQDAETDRRFEDARTIFSAVEADYAWVAPNSDAELPGLNSALAVWDVALTDDDPVIVRSSQVSSLRYILRLGPPVGADQTAGEVLFYDGATLIESRPVVQLDQTA